uniref:Uncharacterized protein n=1 Tax=Arundo donax TaxID=35708 RepID=A0A0A8Y548_ARUDO
MNRLQAVSILFWEPCLCVSSRNCFSNYARIPNTR